MDESTTTWYTSDPKDPVPVPVITYLSLIRPLLASDHSPARALPPRSDYRMLFSPGQCKCSQSAAPAERRGSIDSAFSGSNLDLTHFQKREIKRCKRERERKRIASIGKQQVTDNLTMDDNQGASSAYSNQFARTPDGLPPFRNPDDETTDSNLDPDPFRSDAQPVFPDPQRERERVLREVQNESL
jgi:hypothetical protein